MSNPPEHPVEACLIDLFQQLGLDKAHIAAGRLAGAYRLAWLGDAAPRSRRFANLDQSPDPRTFGSAILIMLHKTGLSARGQCTTEQGVGRILASPHFVKATGR